MLAHSNKKENNHNIDTGGSAQRALGLARSASADCLQVQQFNLARDHTSWWRKPRKGEREAAKVKKGGRDANKS